VIKKLISPWLALITLAIFLVIRLADPALVESVRLRYFDQLITSKPVTVSQQISVVNIDDAYLTEAGQFPFPRGQYAEIINTLYNHGAGLVVFNIYMPDADRFGEDDKLVEILKAYPVVLPQSAGNEPSVGYPPFRPGVSVIGGAPESTGIRYETITPNIESINATATGIGVVNVLPEIDGVVRRVPMVVNSGGELYPSISLETIRVASGDPSFQVKVDEAGIQAVRIPQFGKIATDPYGRIWVDWSTRPTEYSMAALPEDFKGSIVIVGLTARGLNNPVASSGGEIYPHYMQANVLDTVISGTVISRPEWSLLAELGFMIVAVVLSIVLSRWKHGYLFALGAAATVYYGGFYIFLEYQYLIDAIFPIITIIGCSFHAYVVKFIVELNQKLQIKKQFGTYLSPDLVARLQRNPGLLQLGGETRNLSIMFTDVRGFTAISEHYGKDVQGLTKIMNRYMTAMTKRILENNGTLDKYIGDAQMAFWNAPTDNENHAKDAVRTALEMMESLDEFNKEVVAEGIPAFGMGLGINTDYVVVGNMGSDQRFDYTCLGDGVNTAARLEGQSKNYGVKIVIGANTAASIDDEYATLQLDCLAVKGKSVGVNIYTVIGRHDWLMKYSAYVPETQIHEKMLELYRIQKWDLCIKFCEDLKGAFHGIMDGYYELWIERCNEMREKGLPADWDGIYRATSK
tara:strand:- start:1656 stop:3719 length:2064 start_codon:yes stop_codon:yes gene_type:complete